MKNLNRFALLLALPVVFCSCSSVEEGPVYYRRTAESRSGECDAYRERDPRNRPSVSVEYPAPSYIPQKPGAQRTPYTSTPSAYDAPGNYQPSPYSGTSSGSNLTHDRPDQSPY